ncbi:unnamed protein product [Rhizophagus irregularis]|nr:unnamed protein product [Rhizophagus irregularis]CAB5365056.1 unnamed protein product [Rhizophagus irregularis]
MKLFVAQYRNKRILVFSLMINTNTPKEKWVLSEEILKKVHYKGLSSLCLGLLFIRSSFRPFFFTSLFRSIFSASRSSLY